MTMTTNWTMRSVTSTVAARWAGRAKSAKGMTIIAVAGLVALLALAGNGCRDAGSHAGSVAAGREGAVLSGLELVALDGRAFTTESLRGKVVIVDFWDTWCGPCLRALPHLKELSRSHPDQVVVIAVALGQEGEAKVREVVDRQELPFAVALLASQGDLSAVFGEIDALPTTFLVGPDGVIRRRWVGAQSLPTYDKAVRELLAS